MISSLVLVLDASPVGPLPTPSPRRMDCGADRSLPREGGCCREPLSPRRTEGEPVERRPNSRARGIEEEAPPSFRALRGGAGRYGCTGEALLPPSINGDSPEPPVM